MQVYKEIAQLRQQIKQWRDKGESIALVPTMGNLHAGHLSLVTLAQQHAERTVVSIYVNPLQFSPDEDFASYPRTLDDDLAQLEALNVDLVLVPDTAMIYPQGELHSTFIEVPGLSRIIEGEFRPGFFRGVATVVLKLFNMVGPDIAVFGEKDYQQLLIIRRMVDDLKLPVKIIGAETRRETDGLAMSSRNNYLDAGQREKSRYLSAALQQFRQQLEQGVTLEQAEDDCKNLLVNHGLTVDYVTLREASGLDAVSDDALRPGAELIILAAARIGRTRLIDNVKFIVGARV